jgi:hypothetical protein
VRKIAKSSKAVKSSDEVEWEKHKNEFTFKPNLYHPRFAKHRRRRKVRKAKGDSDTEDECERLVSISNTLEKLKAVLSDDEEETEKTLQTE